MAIRAVLSTHESRPFAGSADVKRRFEHVPVERMRKYLDALSKMAGWDFDLELIDYLANDIREHQIDGLEQLFRITAKIDPSTALARHKAGIRFVCALHIFELVPDNLNHHIKRPTQLARIMSDGADGLITSASAQWVALAMGLASIAKEALSRPHKRIVIMDSPRGGNVPATALEYWLTWHGRDVHCERLLAPRKDTGKFSLKTHVNDIRRRITDDCLIVYVDDAVSGTRFGKILKCLDKAFGENRVIGCPILMSARTSSQEELEARGSLITKMRERRKRLREADIVHCIEVPRWRLHIDDGAPIEFEGRDSDFAWVGSDLLIGGRKANLLFEILHRWREILNELMIPKSKMQSLLKTIWSRDVEGKEYILLDSAVVPTMLDLVSVVNWEEIFSAARNSFPDDLKGLPIRPSLEAVIIRFDWMVDTLTAQVTASKGVEQGNCFNRALRDLNSILIGHLPIPTTKEYRDHDFQPYFLPYCAELATFHKMLSESVARLFR